MALYSSTSVRLVGALTVDEPFSMLYVVACLWRIPGSIRSANVLQEQRVSFKEVQAQLALIVIAYTYRLYAITIKASWACTFFKETRCSCKTLLNTEDTGYRYATANNTEKDSSTVKDPTSHTNTEAML